jgi:anti-anti-sigma factor
MLNIHSERLGDVAVIQCQGRIVQSDAVYKLRDLVRQQRGARVILLDLSEVDSIQGPGVGMLLLIQQWTRERGIQFKIFDPPYRVQRMLAQTRSASAFEIAGMSEVLELLGWDDVKPLAERAQSHGAVSPAA